MKKLVSLLLVVCGFSFSALGQTNPGGGTPQPNPIPLEPKPGTPPTIPPRSLSPVVAYLAIDGVDLQFTEDLGMAVVTVINQTTGEQWLDYVDTATGYAHIDTSTPNPTGVYLIYIELEDGSSYWGEFLRE